MDSNAISRLTDPVFIRGLLERHGFRFSKALGQNFLTDASVPARIADALCADESCAVLEVGPGIGCLTAELAERAGAVLSVELDRRLEPVLRETLAPFSNTGLLFGDIMKQDLAVLADGRLTAPTRLFCANLPYNITTPVLTKVLESGVFARSVVMIQREVAERLCAAPGGKDYGAFSLLVQWHAEPEMLFKTLESLLAGKPPRQEAGEAPEDAGSAGAHAEGRAQAPDGQPAPEAGEERRQS